MLQGRGSYEERTEMLRLIVDLVEASIYADTPDWRLGHSFSCPDIINSSCFVFGRGKVDVPITKIMNLTFVLHPFSQTAIVFFFCFNYFWHCNFVLHFCSVDEQVAKDIQLIDSIAEKQAQIFSEECKLFPADVQIQSIYPLYEFPSPLYPKYKLIYLVFDSIPVELPKTTLFLFIEYFSFRKSCISLVFSLVIIFPNSWICFLILWDLTFQIWFFLCV